MTERELHELSYEEQEQRYFSGERYTATRLEDIVEFCPYYRSYMTAQTLLINRHKCPYCKEIITTGGYSIVDN